MAEFRLSNFTSGTALTAAELNTGLTFADYTPTWTQGTAITHTKNWARYTKFGKMVLALIKLTATGSGTANNQITVSLPINASTNNYLLGTYCYEQTVGGGLSWSRYNSNAVLLDTSSTMCFALMNNDGQVARQRSDVKLGQNYVDVNGTTQNGITISSGQFIHINLMYEAA